jgi:hypothetical protein
MNEPFGEFFKLHPADRDVPEHQGQGPALCQKGARTVKLDGSGNFWIGSGQCFWELHLKTTRAKFNVWSCRYVGNLEKSLFAQFTDDLQPILKKGT